MGTESAEKTLRYFAKNATVGLYFYEIALVGEIYFGGMAVVLGHFSAALLPKKGGVFPLPPKAATENLFQTS